MKTYISLLRGINVGGHKIIKMTDLKLLFQKLLFENVTTYIQSGNVIFKTEETAVELLSKKITEQIFSEYGFDVHVTSYNLQSFKELIQNNPFLNETSKKEEFFHITCFSKHIENIDIESLSKKINGEETFILHQNCLYLYLPYGYGNTKLTNTFFEKKLNQLATTRNWKTMKELLKIAENL